jgi:drug/metabolite transporter (DMT)-like permease
MSTKTISTGVQFVLFVLGLFSGYLAAVAPISDESLRIVPGGIASFAALILLLLARAIAKSLPTAKARRHYWLALAVVVSLPAVWFILHYADLWQRRTVEVPVSIRDGKLELGRRIKGTVLTDRAQAYVDRKAIKNPDDRALELIQVLGGIPAVWTQQSIQDQWWVLTRAYLLSIAGTVLALSFLSQSLATRAR